MRRRRRHLEVSTFPFLAVLLCTMGSLILLLLVLDRRAKIVAQRKAQSDYALVQAERDHRAQERLRQQAEEERLAYEHQAERQAEWEQRRQQLHALLAQEEQDLLGQIQQTRDQVAVANTKLQSEQDRADRQKNQLQIANSRLTGLKQTVTATQDSAVKEAKQTEAAKRELERQAIELQQLEQTLASLKTLRERQKNTYSLVPYLGRRGDNRKPVYVECASSAVIFHPDRIALEGMELTGERLRAEVVKRITSQREQAPSQPNQEPARPYLLMLVRPGGIRTYYQTQEALAGMNIEFGYEFIEPDWVLDFSVVGNDVAAQPWMKASQLPDSLPGSPSAPERRAGLGGASGRGLTGSGVDSGMASRGALAQGGNSGGASTPGVGGSITSRGSLAPGIGGGNGDGTLQPGGPNGSGGGSPSISTATPQLSPGASARGVPVPGNNSKEIGKTGSPGISQPSGNGNGTWQPGGPNPSGGGSPGMPNGLPPLPRGTGSQGIPATAGNAKEAATSGSSSMPKTSENGDATLAQGGSTGSGRGSSGMPNGLPPLSPGIGPKGTLGSGSDSQQASNGGNSGGTVPSDSSGTQPSQGAAGARDSKEFANNGENGGGSGGSGGGGGGGYGIGIGSPSTGGVKSTAAPVLLGRVLGNRDWPIYLECNADGVVLKQGNQKFPIESLSAPTRGEHPLVQIVRDMVNRRQATVRPGEPPYRPLLRFQVKPDGLRAYYLAYPLLDSLRLPMARDNVLKDS